MPDRLPLSHPAVQQALGRRSNKFHAKRTEVDGVVFASQKEAAHYRDLRLRERAGEIADLELQPRFEIEIRGSRVCTYVADFAFRDRVLGKRIVQDVKSAPTRTPVYRLKRKLVKAIYGLDVEEV